MNFNASPEKELTYFGRIAFVLSWKSGVEVRIMVWLIDDAGPREAKWQTFIHTCGISLTDNSI